MRVWPEHDQLAGSFSRLFREAGKPVLPQVIVIDGLAEFQAAATAGTLDLTAITERFGDGAWERVAKVLLPAPGTVVHPHTGLFPPSTGFGCAAFRMHGTKLLPPEE